MPIVASPIVRTPSEIVELSDDAVFTFYREFLKGCGGEHYNRLYLDLNYMSLLLDTQSDANTWLQREDGSLVEIAYDQGYGVGLSASELNRLEKDGVQDFGFQEWVHSKLEPSIQEVLESRQPQYGSPSLH